MLEFESSPESPYAQSPKHFISTAAREATSLGSIRHLRLNLPDHAINHRKFGCVIHIKGPPSGWVSSAESDKAVVSICMDLYLAPTHLHMLGMNLAMKLSQGL
jgi:hypothetical protein